MKRIPSIFGHVISHLGPMAARDYEEHLAHRRYLARLEAWRPLADSVRSYWTMPVVTPTTRWFTGEVGPRRLDGTNLHAAKQDGR